MQPIKVGVIGVGHLGQHHARVYKNLTTTELIGIADTNADRAKEIAERHDTTAYIDFQPLIEQCDAVNIAVPTTDHYRVAMAAITAGCHVLIEKPITSTIEQAEKLVAYAKEKNVLIQVGHIERFNSAVLTLEGVIDNPRFIESHRLASFVPRGTDVAVVLDLMIHDLDIILSFVKSKPKEIHAAGISILSNSEDIANARIEFENGCVANVTASRVSQQTVRKIRFFQKDAYISLDFHKKTADVIRLNPQIAQMMIKKTSGYTDLNKIMGMVSKSITFDDLILQESLSVKNEEPLKLELEAFIDCIQNNKKPIVTGNDGLEALRVAYQILQKIHAHQAIG